MKTIEENKPVHIGSLRQDLGPQQKYRPPVTFKAIILTRLQLTHQALRKMDDDEIRIDDFRHDTAGIDMANRVIYESANGTHYVLRDDVGPEFELFAVRHPKAFASDRERDSWVANNF
jgi:hypothetical protein